MIICLPLTRGLHGNVGSWEEPVKLTVPSAQRISWRFVVQLMSDLFLLNMRETWHHFIWILFLRKNNEKSYSWISLVKQGKCFRSKVCQICFCNCMPILHNASVLLLSKFKITCGRCSGFFHSKFFAFSFLFFPTQLFCVPHNFW